jgi:GH15 family glucan-1,4-alpha-glucosidase
MAYRNIDSYALIGDLHTAALVGSDGSIDWCCLPRFDSPSVFGAILDENKGGFFRICAAPEGRCKQMYLPDTNVLVTRFLSEEGVGEVVDFMPWHDGQQSPQAIVRIVRCVRGTVSFEMECRPAFDYARQKHELTFEEDRAAFRTPTLGLLLTGTVPLVAAECIGVKASFVLQQGEKQSFILEMAEQGEPRTPAKIESFAAEILDETIHRWRAWSALCTYKGRWREMVMRSALTLKMLIYEPTGAIVAAPTCSLPESIGGVRNWDYRYTWMRDAAFSMFALLRLGYTKEASRFIDWLQARAAEDQPTGPLQVLYRIDGSSDLTESTLDHLSGYKDSGPVRVGNEAKNQLQLDIYGELIDSVYLYNQHAEPISYDLWTYLRKIVYWVCDNWQRPDSSIWEVRKAAEQYTYSKVQCWVALDRALRIALHRNLPLDIERVRKECNKLYETIMEQGWNGKSFVQTLGGDDLDATSLLLPLVQFITPRDHRMTATVDRILDELVSDSLVYRYKPTGEHADGLPGTEGTFSACTFWLVEVLSRCGRVREARFIFEKMLTYANHVGLYAEQIGKSGQALGNYPQAFTHLALISAALDLNDTLDETVVSPA